MAVMPSTVFTCLNADPMPAGLHPGKSRFISEQPCASPPCSALSWSTSYQACITHLLSTIAELLLLHLSSFGLFLGFLQSLKSQIWSTKLGHVYLISSFHFFGKKSSHFLSYVNIIDLIFSSSLHFPLYLLESLGHRRK